MIYDNYEHVRCRCGGIIGCRTRDDIYRCDRCSKTYVLCKLKYDYIAINDKTGWIFPMKKKEELK